MIYNTFYYTNETRKIVSKIIYKTEKVYSEDWVLCDEEDQVLVN
jgi:hypothetical protein